MIVLIGPSRMFLGEHWASDVLGGYLLGSLTLSLTIFFYRWGKERFLVEQPVAPSLGEDPNIPTAIPVTSKGDETDEDHPDRSQPK